MEREIGGTGIQVYPIGLGAMPLSLEGRPDEATAIGVIKAALDAGVNFIDTANVYCVDDGDIGHNERLIAKALRQLGAGGHFVVATKGGLARPGGAWTVDARPERIRKACEQSLRDLEVETIPLYQLHAPDPRVPFEDSVGMLARLQEEGKIRHIGLSNVSAAQLHRAQRTVKVESVQNRCNPLDQQDIRNGMIRECARQSVAYLPWSPVGGGSGHAHLANQGPIGTIGGTHGASPYQVILAWLLSKGTNVIPIPGASRSTSILDSAQAVHLKLSTEELASLDAFRD